MKDRLFSGYFIQDFLPLGLKFGTNIDEKLFPIIGQSRPYAIVSRPPIGFDLISLLLTVTLLEIREMF
jgi:hypothetical protein